MNNKVEELVEWVAKKIAIYRGLILWDNLPVKQTKECGCACQESCIRDAKQILSHPDLALIDRGKSPPAVYDYIHYQHGEWCFTPKRLSEFIDAKEEYRQSVIPLAEALKEKV